MEPKLINQLKSNLPQLLSLSKKQRSLSIDYDAEADVLYISFEKPTQATDTEMIDDHTLIRKKGNQIIGVTFMHASSQTS